MSARDDLDRWARAEADRIPPEAIDRGVAALADGLRAQRPGHEFVGVPVKPRELHAAVRPAHRAAPTPDGEPGDHRG